MDGKSPVEYITAQAMRELVRTAAGALLRDPASRLGAVEGVWSERVRHTLG